MTEKNGYTFVMNKRIHRKGFTIIEVVLVLGIAGLIFLMVFIALPAAQKAHRDRLRKQDVGIIVAAVRKYMSNNRGNPPPDSGTVNMGSRDIDDPRYDLGVGDPGGDWFSGNHSQALDRYLAGLSEGWVTTTVAVHDARKLKYVFFAIDDEEKAGLVWVIVGAQCPADANDFLTKMTITGKRNDVAVYRYLESGWYWCQNV